MAAGVSDGAIIIDTRLDNSDFLKEARQLRAALDGLKQSVDRIGADLAKAGNGYVASMRKASGAARSTQSEMQRLEAQAEKLQKAMSGDKIYSDAYKEIQAEVDKTEEEIAKLQAKQQEWADIGISPDSSAFEELDTQIIDLIDRIDELQARQEEMRQSGAAYTPGYAAAQQEYADIQARMEEISQAAQGATEAMSQESAAASGLGGAFSRVASSAVSALRVIGRFSGYGAVTALKKLAAGAKNAAIQLAKLAGKAAASGLKMLTAGVTAAAKALFGFNRETRKQSGGLNLSFRNILKYAFGIRSLYVLFNRLRSAVKEAFGVMAKQVPEVKASLTRLKSALNGLKGSLATAFEPILTAVAPALETLINLLTRAINLIGAFFSALTGRGYYYAANGMQAVSNAASNAANDAADLKRQLAGFDELNILSDKSSGGGGGGGGGGAGGISFTQEDIGGGILDFVEALKEMWANADYEGMGRIIAQGINRAFEWAKEHITWDNIGQKITEIIDAITGAFNGFVDELDFYGIGQTIGEGVNTILKAFNRLMDDIDWTNLGSKLTEGLNGLFATVDWNDLGAGFVKKLEAIGDILISFFTNFDWGQSAKAFSDFISGMFKEMTKWINKYDWKEIGTSLAQKIDDIISKLDVSDLANSFCEFLTRAINAGIDLIKSFVVKLVIEPIITNISKIVSAITRGDNVEWKDIVEILKAAALGSSLFLTTTGNYSGAVVALGVALTIEPIVNNIADIINQLKSDGGIAWDRIAGIVKILASSAGLFLIAKGMYGPGIVALGVAISIEPIVNNVSDIINQLKSDGGIAWDRIAGIVKILAANAGLFLLTKGQYASGVVALGVALSIEPIVNNIVDIVNQLKTDGGIAWDRISGIVKILAANAGIFLLTKGNYGSGIVALGVALTIEPIVNSVAEIINQIKTDGGISWERVTGIIKILAANAGIFLLTKGKYGAGVVALGVALTIEPIVNNITDIVNQLKSDGGISWDRIAGIVKILAANAGIFLLTKGNYAAGIVALGIGLAIEPIVNSISSIVQDIKKNGIKWEDFEKILSTVFSGIGVGILGINPVAGVVALTIGIALKFKVISSIIEWIEGSGTDFPDIELPVGFVLENGDIVELSKEVTTGWDGLPSDLKTVDVSAIINDDSNKWMQSIRTWLQAASKTSPAEFVAEVKKTAKEWWDTVLTAWNDRNKTGAKYDVSPDDSTHAKFSWWSTVLTAWNAMGKSGANYDVSPEDGSRARNSWWSTVLGAWNKKNKTGAKYSVAPKNESTSWWSSVVKWWDSVKKTLGFSVAPKTSKDVQDAWVGDVSRSFEKASQQQPTPTFSVKPTDNSWGWAYAVYKGFTDEANGSYWQNIMKFNVSPFNNDWGWAYAVYDGFTNEINGKYWQNIMKFFVTPFDNSWGWTYDVYKGFTDEANGSYWQRLLKFNVTPAITEDGMIALRNQLNNANITLTTTVKTAASGGIATANGLKPFAKGGVIRGGVANWWNSIPKYAGGTKRAHGTVFVAGEAGPEIMGHVNGRTEILNKAQLAQAIYGAVVSGMAEAVNALGRYLGDRMAVAANAVISAIGMTGLSGVTYREPLMASGTVLPYDIAAQIAKTGADIQDTLDANNEDLIQTIISVVGAQTSAIVAALRNNGQGASVGGMSAQQVINEINRRTQMFGASPLQGV